MNHSYHRHQPTDRHLKTTPIKFELRSIQRNGRKESHIKQIHNKVTNLLLTCQIPATGKVSESLHALKKKGRQGNRCPGGERGKNAILYNDSN